MKFTGIICLLFLQVLTLALFDFILSSSERCFKAPEFQFPPDQTSLDMGKRRSFLSRSITNKRNRVVRRAATADSSPADGSSSAEDVHLGESSNATSATLNDPAVDSYGLIGISTYNHESPEHLSMAAGSATDVISLDPNENGALQHQPSFSPLTVSDLESLMGVEAWPEPPEDPSSALFGPGIESEVSEDESDDEMGPLRDRQYAGRCGGRPAVQKLDIGPMNITCVDCGALHFAGEVKSKCWVNETTAKFTQCCSKGKVELQSFQDPPRLLKTLLNGNHILSNHFKDHIRQYNSSMAFASMVAQQSSLSPGPYSYVVHGQVYHNVGCLQNDDVEESQYAQLYILDSDLATELRMRRNQMVLSEDLLKEVTQIIYNVNVIAKSYQMMQTIVSHNASPEIYMVFDDTKHIGSRRHNVAAADQIAAVFVSDDGEVPTNRALVVRPKGRDLRRISVLSPFLDPMVYPILFPFGDMGWKPTLKLKNGKRLTMLNYYAHRLGYRPGSYIHQSGKLWQQYIVDAYCRIEENNLNYIKLNQKKLRADSYQGLMDHLANQAEEEGASVGRRVILPSSFGGGPRNMAQHYQDSMRIVAKLGKPDLFVTFTCNPAWDEIKNELLPGQKATDRPDLVARIFKVKLDAFIDDLLKQHVLGRVIGHVGVVEFQKRGLPHVHLLLTLHPEDKIRTRRQLNNIVCAEIPDVSDPAYEKVMKHLIHGPCGDLNPNSPCMVNGKCSHSFPKPFSPKSHVKKKGSTVYKRREGTSVNLGRFKVGNEWVVPYNRYLLLKYDAHINVEVCASIKSVKYLYKYIYKGHDAASIVFGSDGSVINYDEVQQFIEARFISSHEACWRIFRSPMQMKSHAIIRLAVHEQNEQTVVFEEGEEDEAAAKAADRYSTLTAFFALNESWSSKAHNPSNKSDPRNLYYAEIPERFTFKPTEGWKPRIQSANEIGRMYFVSPHYVERFHLRLLLLHTKGANSFESIRTVLGVTYPTFKEACMAMGLIELDGELEETLAEAARLYSAEHVRQVFADILAGCTPANPVNLWDTFKDQMIEDFVYAGMSIPAAEATAYEQIRALTEKHHVQLEKLIPVPAVSPVDLPQDSEEYIALAAQPLAEQLYSSLNLEQKSAADRILAAVSDPALPRLFFIDGPGGSGKTYLYSALNQMFLSSRKKALNVAWSGIAAQLLLEGRTAHSAFTLPVPVTKDNFMPVMKVNTSQADVLRKTDVIIWDEASMAPRYAVEGVNLLLQDIMRNDLLFGGKVVIFGGDFRQIPPIVKEKHDAAVVEATLKRSFLWNHLQKHSLSVNMRVQGNEEPFKQFLLDLGEGKVKKNENGMITIPESLRSGGDLVSEIYGTNFTELSPAALAQRVILSLRNADCDKLNDRVLELLPADPKTYYSRDEAVCDEPDMRYPIEFLHDLTPSGMPPHELKLKAGAVVMLLRNLNVKKGLCNGTRMIVQKLNHFNIECKTVATDQVVILPRITTTPCDSNLPFVLKRRQFPIKLCFSMSINKSQGQSFDKVGVHLPSLPFSHGHLYVAFSRCRSSQGLKVLAENDETRNVVLPELLN